MQRLLVLVSLVALATACGPGTSFQVAQYSEAFVPGLENRALVTVGDIHRGAVADIEVVDYARQRAQLAYRPSANEGDEIHFSYDGVAWVISVDWYEDHTFSTDIAHLSAWPAD